MADTMGLMKTRAEYLEELSEGRTDMSHKDWYEAKYGKKDENLSDVMAEKEKAYKKQGSLQQVFK